ncbi:MAG TPA: PaaI family thioesterase [Acidimicrobiia bacterium]|nr:PaaI family thioesterase [Acidimicrobiia bacterium]
MPPTDHRIQVPPNCDLTLGMVCLDKGTPGRTVWRMAAAEKFANPAGIMQGGFVAALADSAMGASAVTFLEGRKAFVANAELKVSFLRPVRIGSELTCTARVLSGGKRVAFLEAEIVDDEARVVLRATSTYVYTDRD